MSLSSLEAGKPEAPGARRLPYRDAEALGGELGDVFVALPAHISALAIALCLGVLIVAAIAAFTEIASYETVAGQVAPTGGVVRLAARNAGFVEQLNVSEGDRVDVGGLVALIRTTEAAPGRAEAPSASDEIQRQITEVDNQRAAAVAKLALDREALQNQLLVLGSQLTEAEDRLEISVKKQRASADKLQRATPVLEKGFISANAYAELQNALLEAEATTSRTRVDVLTLKGEIQDRHAQLASIPVQIAKQDAESAQSRSSLRESLIAAQSTAYNHIYAPQAAVVLAIPVSAGQSVNVGDSIAILAPAAAGLRAELYVPSRSIGFVQVGQPVRFLYDAFPSQRYGVGSGRVAAVSRTILSPEDLKNLGSEIKEPAFRVMATIDRPFVAAYGRTYLFRPGMRLTAEIETRRDSFWNSLTARIFGRRKE